MKTMASPGLKQVSQLDVWMLGCLGFIHTLEIIARMLSEVVNRERLCGTQIEHIQCRLPQFWGFKPLEEVPTQSIFVWVVGF